jgi:hypothetical protein
MAIVRSNDLIEGFSGMFGDTMVFRNLRGKTVVSQRPKPPKKQSEQQKSNRSKFRQATMWAQSVLEDPERKEYYRRKAKKLNLPNAYTAAITDYMRSPMVAQDKRNGVTTVCVKKKDFSLKKVEITLSHATDGVKPLKIVSRNGSEDWVVDLKQEQYKDDVIVSVWDDTGRCWCWDLKTGMGISKNLCF